MTYCYVEIGENVVMHFRFDDDANALYVALHEGAVARTLELTELIYVDVDASGAPLGIEFVSADEFLTFLRRLQARDPDDDWVTLVPAEVRQVFAARAA